jgi:RND family efflux transporter MFP subunit
MLSKLNSLFAAQIEKAEKSKFLERFGKKTRRGIAFAAILLVAAGSAYFFQWQATNAKPTNGPSAQTSIARRGDLVLYASGTGTLVALDEVDLGFKTSGQVLQINVEVGDKVQAGDVLATIDDSNARMQYTQAKRALLELTSPAAIAAAEEAVADAKISLMSANNHLAYLISPAVYYWELEVEKAKAETAALQDALKKSANDAELKTKLEKAEAYLDYAEDKLEGNWYFYERQYLPNNFSVWDPESGTKYVAAPTDADIASARASVTKAKAALQEAEYYYAALTGGEVPEDATGSGLSELEQAKLNLEEAELAIAGATLIAPINGTVMSIDMSVGDTVGTSTVITVADLSQPYLEVFLDESDWANIQVGYPAEVIFDILPDSTFEGEVIQVDPGLYSESGATAVRAIVKLNGWGEGDFNLPLGTSAAVDIIGGKATDAVLIPVEALHDAGNGQYGVLVMTNGAPRLRLVEVGVQDLTSAEIISGLEAGEVVTTGIAETK